MHLQKRCPWVKDELDRQYHDTEWGVPEHNDQKLFEFLVLEGMQAGLSWNLILRRREAMRQAFDCFDPNLISNYQDDKIQQLLLNPNIIRNRAKMGCLPGNAQAFLEIQNEFGSFDTYLWNYVDGTPIDNQLQDMSQAVSSSPLSDALSKDLKKRGFRFVGSTICYSFMQATGLINDHLLSCPFHDRCLEYSL